MITHGNRPKPGAMPGGPAMLFEPCWPPLTSIVSHTTLAPADVPAIVPPGS